MASVDEVLLAANSDDDSGTIEWNDYLAFYENSTLNTAIEYADADVVEIDHEGNISDSIKTQLFNYGQANSQYIVFQRDRYFDGVDLADESKTIDIAFKRSDGQFSRTKAINVRTSKDGTLIQYGWVVPSEATAVEGTLIVASYIWGTKYDSSDSYILTDGYIELTVNASVIASGDIVKIKEDSWYQQFVNDCATAASQAQGYANAAATSAKSIDTVEKRASAYAYVTQGNISWKFTNSCDLQITGTVTLYVNGTKYTLASDAFLTLAADSGIVTVADGVVSGNDFALVYDLSDSTFKMVQCANISTTFTLNNIILFEHYYLSHLSGLLVDAIEDKRVYHLETDKQDAISDLGDIRTNASSANAEVQDIRTGADGTKYVNAGTAVRWQVDNLASDIVYTADEATGVEHKFFHLPLTKGTQLGRPSSLCAVEAAKGKRLITRIASEALPDDSSVTYAIKGENINVFFYSDENGKNEVDHAALTSSHNYTNTHIPSEDYKSIAFWIPAEYVESDGVLCIRVESGNETLSEHATATDDNIEHIMEDIGAARTVEWTVGKTISSTGEEEDSDEQSCSGFIDIQDAESYIVHTTDYLAVCPYYYDSAKTYKSKGSWTNKIRNIVSIPSGMLYIRLAAKHIYTATATSPTLEELGVVSVYANLKNGISGYLETVRDSLTSDITEKLSRNEMVDGVKTLLPTDYTFGYIGTGTTSGGVLSDSIHGIYTPELSVGTTVSVDSTDDIGVAMYSYDADTGEFAGVNTSIVLPHTHTATGVKRRYLAYWKSTGIYTAITEERARELFSHVTITTPTEVLATNSEIESLDERIDALEKGSTPIADYYVTEAEETVGSVIEAATEPCYAVCFVTDSHHDGTANVDTWDETAANLKYVNELYPFDAIIHGGDLTTGNVSKTITVARDKAMQKDMYAANPNYYILTGNHDDNSYEKSTPYYSQLITQDERYAIYQRNTATKVYRDDCGGYYWDIPLLNLRIICLESLCGYGYVWENVGVTGKSIAEGWGYTDETLSWFTGTALNTTNQVAIFSHMPFTDIFDCYTYQPKNGEEMRKAVNKFIEDGGTVVGLFHGHTHWDYIGQYTGSNLYEISTACSKCSETTPGTKNPADIVVPKRTYGTVTADLWDCIVIKPQSRHVDLIRFGAGDDRSFDY